MKKLAGDRKDIYIFSVYDTRGWDQQIESRLFLDVSKLLIVFFLQAFDVLCVSLSLSLSISLSLSRSLYFSLSLTLSLSLPLVVTQD